MYLNDLSIGLELTTPSVPVEKAGMLAFAKDFNPCPIHMDEDYASRTHFGQLLAPGMYTFLLIWAKYMEQDFFGEELIAGKSTKVEWERPVFAQDTLTGHARITNLIQRNARSGIAELTIDIYNQRQERVLTSTTEAIVKAR